MRFPYYSDVMFYNGSSWDRYFSSRADEMTTYDVIIVGSGMGGGILANETSNHGLRTLVLEAGPIRHLVNITDLPLPNLVDSIDPYTQAKGTDLRGGVCFNLGGRSVYWSAVIPRMKDWELGFWPESIRTYLTAAGGYDKAEKLFRKRVDHPRFQRRLQKRVQERFTDWDVTQLPRSYHQPDSRQNPRPGSPDERSTGVFSTASLLTDSLMNTGPAGADYLDVAVQHLVDRVVLSGRRAVSVEALDLRNGVRRIFRGRHIVLAGGTTESARLAITSGVESSPLLGRGLSDHPEAEVHFDIPEDFQVAGFNAQSQGNLFLRPRDGTVAEQSFSCELALNWKYWDVRIVDDARWEEDNPKGANPAIRSTVKFLFHQPLEDENTVTVDDTCGEYMVHLKPLARPLEAQATALADQLLDFFTVEKGNRPPLIYNSYSVTYHLAGSMRLGEDPTTSVVDTDLRFHEYANLWCCDLSVFPDVPASNPSLTLGALALRLAATLKDR